MTTCRLHAGGGAGGHAQRRAAGGLPAARHMYPSYVTYPHGLAPALLACTILSLFMCNYMLLFFFQALMPCWWQAALCWKVCRNPSAGRPQAWLPHTEKASVQAAEVCTSRKSSYLVDAGRTLLEVLQDFPSAAPPLAWLLQAGPRLQPRRFSIASSPRAHPDEAGPAARPCLCMRSFRLAFRLGH